MLADKGERIPHVNNIRDLGGYPTKDGRIVKWCKLIRSGLLNKLDSADHNYFCDHRIKTTIDLRSYSEIEKWPDSLPLQTKYLIIPLSDNSVLEDGNFINTLQKFYSETPRGGYIEMINSYEQLVISKKSQLAYYEIFKYLLENKTDEAVIIHCSAGKDRTGLVCALVLLALGVDRQVVYEDYLLTNKLSIKRIYARIMEVKTNGENENFIRSIYDLSVVHEAYLKRALDIIDDEYGGVGQFLCNEVGITAKEISDLQKIYLTSLDKVYL